MVEKRVEMESLEQDLRILMVDFKLEFYQEFEIIFSDKEMWQLELVRLNVNFKRRDELLVEIRMAERERDRSLHS